MNEPQGKEIDVTESIPEENLPFSWDDIYR